MNLKSSIATISMFTPAVTARGLKFFVWVLSAMIGLNLLQLLMSYTAMAGVAIVSGLLVGLLFGFVMTVLCELVFLYVRRFSPCWQSLSISRSFNNNLPVYHQSQVQLSLTGYDDCDFWTRYLALELIDGIPENTYADELPVWVLAGDIWNGQNDKVDVHYPLMPFFRGTGRFDGVWFRLFGLWGLFSLNIHISESDIDGQHSVRVLANFKDNLDGNLLATAHKSLTDGMLKQRRRGLGQDFHQIRSYSEGDSVRRIDWRATSRLGRLMSREYQDEQDQEILFLLDASLMSRHSRYTDEGIAISHLDTVLNAMLLLSSIAIKQGDAVGFISFCGINDKIVAPKKDLSRLINQSFDIDSSLKMPDYMAAAKAALSLQKKRSLIILLTTTRSEEFGELISAVNLLRAKHLVIVANLYEEDLSNIINSLPEDGNDARTYHSVQEQLSYQHELKVQLENLSQVYGLHCTPSRLSKLLINHYLGLKQTMKF